MILKQPMDEKIEDKEEFEQLYDSYFAKKKTKLEWSKLLCIYTGILQLLTLISCICMTSTAFMDFSIFVTAVTSTSGIFGATVIYYFCKSRVENVVKLKITMLIAKAKLESAYGLRHEESDHAFGELDEMTDGAINNEFSEAINKNIDTSGIG